MPRVLLALLARLPERGLRDTFLEADARRGCVQEQTNAVEAHQLQLQNLLREIRRCRGFSTKEMDKIEFADGDVPKVDADVHRRHLGQLMQELHIRTSMQEELKEVKLKIAKMEDGGR
ncbi:hypothetical protein PF011_g19418 [Phytophthora fragariae]|uniref:Uncharacterized protein n=1 Tax=Phytophthora fragariae TaxID=53985 RepID=A0A6A3J0C1_9STRA|nr:hypothetical protein PF011_g19418 [Phytophthora fragariae]